MLKLEPERAAAYDLTRSLAWLMSQVLMAASDGCPAAAALTGMPVPVIEARGRAVPRRCRPARAAIAAGQRHWQALAKKITELSSTAAAP